MTFDLYEVNQINISKRGTKKLCKIKEYYCGLIMSKYNQLSDFFLLFSIQTWNLYIGFQKDLS